jgi:hypothetical protein
VTSNKKCQPPALLVFAERIVIQAPAQIGIAMSRANRGEATRKVPVSAKSRSTAAGSPQPIGALPCRPEQYSSGDRIFYRHGMRALGPTGTGKQPSGSPLLYLATITPNF